LTVYHYDEKKSGITVQRYIDLIEDMYLKGLGSKEVYEYIKLGSKKHNVSLDVILKKIHNIDTKRVIIDPQHTNAKGF
jgi:hypothetical protein